METGVDNTQPTEAELKVALCNLVKLQNIIAEQLQISAGQLANVTRGVNMILCEIERRTTVNPDRPN